LKRFIQFEPLFVRHFEAEYWPYSVHNHNYFELLFIHSGKGIHELNGERMAYAGKCLYFLSPDDSHLFQIEERTEFSAVNFINGYLDSADETVENRGWNRMIDHLIVIKNSRHSRLADDADELAKIEMLVRLIVQEWQENAEHTNTVILSALRTVFAIIRRDTFGSFAAENLLSKNRFMDLMNHIHNHIHQPEINRVQHLANHFAVSASHLSQTFKAETGVSIKKYIDDYKFKLIENRLKYSTSLIKEISAEFGFNDLSHFNKFVKKQSGKNPKDFRREG